jgi:ATP-binding cassette subfamily F protein uup
LEQLEKDMPQLQEERSLLEERMNKGNMAFDELQKAAERVGTIAEQLDAKEMRWLELSEKI